VNEIALEISFLNSNRKVSQTVKIGAKQYFKGKFEKKFLEDYPIWQVNFGGENDLICTFVKQNPNFLGSSFRDRVIPR